MNAKHIASIALLAGSAFAMTSAQAAFNVTLNPAANNGGVGVIDAAVGAFNTVGFSSDLSASLTINSNTGSNVAFSETGTINVTKFLDSSNNTIASLVNSAYTVYGTFTINGTGSWSGSQFTDNAATTVLSLSLFAKSTTNQIINLGTAGIDPSLPPVAFAIGFGSVAAGSTGVALTSLSSNLSFTPNANTVGANGFFQAPNPFNVVMAVGNAGGNSLNTGYAVDATGKVTFTTPIPGTNAGTANVTFAPKALPEPGALALVGIAMLGLGLSRRRAAK